MDKIFLDYQTKQENWNHKRKIWVICVLSGIVIIPLFILSLLAIEVLMTNPRPLKSIIRDPTTFQNDIGHRGIKHYDNLKKKIFHYRDSIPADSTRGLPSPQTQGASGRSFQSE